MLAVQKKIRLTVVGANDLSKQDVFRLPDPFAIITVDEDQAFVTSIIGRTLNPYWNESFHITVKDTSVIAVQIVDQFKFKRNEQCFLGFSNVTVSDVFDFRPGGREMLTLELKASDGDDNVTEHGKLIIYLSVDDGEPITNHVSQAHSVTPVLADADVDRSDISLSPCNDPSGGAFSRSPTAYTTEPATIPVSTLHTPSSPSTADRDLSPSPPSHSVNSGSTGLPDAAREADTVTTTISSGATNPQRIVTPDVDLTGTSPSPQLGPLPPGWEMRLSPTARLYFVDHNTKTTSWDDPRLLSPSDLDTPQCIRDFQRKLTYCGSQPVMRPRPGACCIKVSRSHIFEDGYVEIMKQTPNSLKQRLSITFDGEDNLNRDARTFFSLLSHEILNPSFCLFEYACEDKTTIQITPSQRVDPEHLGYFKFIGRCLALCILHPRFLDVHLADHLYKMILGKKITLHDMESVDAELYRTLTWMLENNVAGVDKTFTTTEERLGEAVTIELKPGGGDIPVTEENKKEYVDAMVEYCLSRRVKEQFGAIMSGFNELIPQELIAVFDERELGWLISGVSEIDVDDWFEHTTYQGYAADDDVIQWFWKCVRSWPPERTSRLLQFATGTSRIPVTGFKDLPGPAGRKRFTIGKSGDTSQGPRSHPRVNRIDLPPYKDYASLEQKLGLALGFSRE